MAPIITPRCDTGIFPDWLPVEAALPDSPRCVLCTDGEGVWVGCYNRVEIIWSPADEGTEKWQDAQTEEAFDSVITHWMEMPEPYPQPRQRRPPIRQLHTLPQPASGDS